MEEKSLLEDAALSIPGEYGHPIPREVMLRELGFNGPFSRHSVGKAPVSATLKTKAVHTMCTKNVLKKKNFKLPAGARTTFHMAFSPDGTKVASCHGDHNVYVSDIGTMKVLQTLSGHPRTPWCVVFHPTQNDVLASGCLAGHVRVWDLDGGGSELLVCDSGTVIASLSFHPTVRLLAIATFNEIIFWDWGVGPYPISRCSTGNTKEKVRLVRFDRLGHNLVTGITNFPNPPGVVTEGEPNRNSRHESRSSAFFRPNILSRTPQPTHAPTRSFSPPPTPQDDFDIPVRQVGLLDDPDGPLGSGVLVSMAEAASPTVGVSVAEALNDRQERFQESYRQLVNHYEDLVQHYQQFIRTRLGVHETPGVEFIPISDSSDDTSPETSNDSPPIDIVVSENPSIQDPDPIAEQVDSTVVVIDDEIPGPSSRILLPPVTNPDINSELMTSIPNEGGQDPEQRTNNNSTDLRSIQALEQNIVEMQNLCSQARRDSTHFPVEPVHIRELRTIRRHLEVLQDQTRRLQSSIRQTLSSLARGTGSLEALRSRLTSIIPPVTSGGEGLSNQSPQILQRDNWGIVGLVRAPPPPTVTPPISLIENITITPGTESITMETSENSSDANATLGSSPASSSSTTDSAPNSSQSDQSTTTAHITTFSSGGGRNPLRSIHITLGPRHHVTSSQRVPPVVPMQYDFDRAPGNPVRPTATGGNSTTNGTTAPGHFHIGTIPAEPLTPSQQARFAAANRFAREFLAEAANEHSRFCPYGEGNNASRPPSRMRCISDLGESPELSIWPTMETGQERAVRSYRLSPEDMATRTIVGSSSTVIQAQAQNQSYGPDRNNNSDIPLNQNQGSFPSYGNWMGQGGPQWINNDVGVRVYLTVRQFSERINSLRSERDQLLAERDQLLTRRARVTTALARAERSRNLDRPEAWQRNFTSGVALIPSNVRDGLRQYHHRRRQQIYRHPPHVYARPVPVRPTPASSTAPSGPFDDLPSTPAPSADTGDPQTSNRPTAVARRDPPSRLVGNFQRSSYMRLGEDFVPVYSHMRDRDIPHQNVFVFPLGLFLEGNGWGTTSIAIYWPYASREEEESMVDFRRSESLIPIITEEAEPLMDSRSTRYRIEYDPTQLTIHVAEGYSLTFIQPGLPILDATTTMTHFGRPRENSGTVYIAYLSPFLDALERIFGYRRLRSNGAQGTALRLSTVLQPGPFNRAVQYSIRTRRLTESPSLAGSSGSARPRAPDDVNPEVPSGSNVATNNVTVTPAQLPQVNVRLRRDLIRDWDRSGSVYRSGMVQNVHVNPSVSSLAERGLVRPDRDLYDSPRSPSMIGEGSMRQGSPEPSRDWASMEWSRRAQMPEGWMLGGGSRGPTVQTLGSNQVPVYMSQSSREPDTSDSASLASTRRVIRLAVDTAASYVLRRNAHQHLTQGYGPHSLISSDFRSFETNPSRAIESRIERVLNERGNRGGMDFLSPVPGSIQGVTNSGTRIGSGNQNPSASTQTMLYSVWGSQQQPPVETNEGGPIVNEGGIPTSTDPLPVTSGIIGETTSTIPSDGNSNGEATTYQRRRQRHGGVSDFGDAIQVRIRQPGGNDMRGVVTSARPLRRSYAYRTGESSTSGGGGDESDEDSDEDDEEPVPTRIPRLSGEEASRMRRDAATLGAYRRRPRTHEHRLRMYHRHLEMVERNTRQRREYYRSTSGGVYSMDVAEGNRNEGERDPERYPPVARRVEWVSGRGSPPRHGARRILTRGTGEPPVTPSLNPNLRREPRHPPNTNTNTPNGDPPPAHSAPSGYISHFFRRVPYPTQDNGHSGGPGNPVEEPTVGARFYPGYIPEIVITPRARPPNYYTLDASTTAFLSSRIQKWDFSSYLIPNIESREESVVVKECSLHSDACLDLSNDGDFMAVCIPSDSGAYSAVGIYSIRDESLGDIIHMYHFDQNTVSVSISPSCDYIVVGYAGRGGPLYRFVHQSRSIGQILSLTRDGEGGAKLVTVKELFADNQSTLMSINCMHWVPVSGYGIIYGTNTGELVLLS